MSLDPVTIDIVSDVVCPWCYVGKRRLEAALKERPDVRATIRWHPFQLDPTIPPGGLDRQSYMARKFGSLDRVEEIHARLEEAGRGAGLAFAFDKIKRAVNTLDAHRVLTWASREGVANAAKEALMQAYFTDGRDLGDRTVLGEIAGGVGLDRDTVVARLATDQDVDTVKAGVAQAVKMGVSGVPFFIFGQAFAVSGAQSAEILAAALARAHDHQADPQAAVMQA